MKLIMNLTVICVLIVAAMQYTRQPLREPNRLSACRYKYSSFLIFLFGFAIMFVAAFREGFVDTQVYKHLYGLAGSEWENAFNDVLPIEDRGFSLMMVFLNQISPDPQLLVMVTSVITFTAYLHVMRTYAKNLPLTLFLFFALSYLASINGIRQVMAGAILALALPWLRDRKAVPYLLLVLLLSTFHGSILVMIPLYFVISGRRLNIGMWAFLLAVVLCFLAPGMAQQVMGTLLEDSVYVGYLENESKMGIMRFLVALAPAALTIMYCVVQRGNRDGENKSSPNYMSQRMIDILINMEIVSFGFIALGLRMVYFARISMYFSVVLPLLLPVLIDGTFEKHSAKRVRTLAIALYFAYFLYQVYTYENYGYFYDFYLIF